jgi:hypothetical protein
MAHNDPKFSFGPSGEDFKDSSQGNLPKLELELAPDLGAPEATRGYNPYDRTSGGGKPAAPAAQTQRTDLRKLSEWIKLRQQVEAQGGVSPDETGEHQGPTGDKPR